MDSRLEEKLGKIQEKFERIVNKMGEPEVASNHEEYQKYAKEHSYLEPIISAFKTLKEIKQQIEDDTDIIHNSDDNELIELAKEELPELEKEMEEKTEEMKLMLVPPDPNDEKNVIMEIRAGTGGDEAAIFAGDLYRMYIRICEKSRWKTELIEENTTEKGGFKEVVFSISGDKVYSKLKFENGVHRVQRVPETETQGRVHTSAASVVVMPEVEDVEVKIKKEDLVIDTFRASGSGGQHVNTTDSAVRMTHVPTGIVVSCQDEKSQSKNRAKALKVMKVRIYDKMLREQQAEVSSNRKSIIGSGDRSEKIRTYNYPQNRVTDHRINLTLYSLTDVMVGDLTELISQMQIADRAEKLEQGIEV
ncbi:MAG: peptide chain release factor 1 [Calditrichia bacterium]|nr:peptide chain release factor 1 [Calditrichia bacterium]